MATVSVHVCACEERSVAGEERRGGNTNIWSHACHMKLICEGVRRGRQRQRCVLQYMMTASCPSLLMCHLRIALKGTSLFQMLQSPSYHKYTLTLAFVAPKHTLNHSCREKVVVGCVWSINSNSTLHKANTASFKSTKETPASASNTHRMSQSIAARYNVWVFGHKGQNLKADGLMSVEAWFGSSLRVSLSAITTSMKALSSKQRQSIPRWSSSHPSDYPNNTYRRALFGGVLTLNGQRNYHKQLLSYSERERLTFVRLSLHRRHWHTDKTPTSDLLKEIYPNMLRNTFLPFWVCPSSMSSSIVLILVLEQQGLCKMPVCVAGSKPYLFLRGSPQSTSAFFLSVSLFHFL